MNEIEIASPLGMVRWLLRSASIDEVTKRFVLFASALYVTGIVVKNLALYPFGLENLTPIIREAAIIIGALAFAANIIVTLLSAGFGWLSKRYLPTSKAPLVSWIVPALLNVVLTWGFLLLAFQVAYLYLTWVYFAPLQNLREVFWLALVIALPVQLSHLSVSSLRGWSVAPLIALTACFCGYTWIYQDVVYPAIPQWLGGGHPQTVRFILTQEASKVARVAGLYVFDNGLTPSVEIVDSDDQTFTLFGVNTIKNSPASSTGYPYSLTIKRDGVQTIIHKPFGWRWETFADNSCWGVDRFESASWKMGDLSIQGLGQAEMQKLRKDWTLKPADLYKNCYSSHFLDTERVSFSELRRYQMKAVETPVDKDHKVYVDLVFSKLGFH